MLVILSGIFTDVIAVLLNTFVLREVRDVGILKDDKEEQPAKALAPNVETPLGNTTELREVQ